MNLVNAINFIDQTKLEGQPTVEKIVPKLSEEETDTEGPHYNKGIYICHNHNYCIGFDLYCIQCISAVVVKSRNMEFGK